MKKRYVLAALAAMTVLAGCGDNASQQKNTDNTTQESTTEDDLTAADPDEDGEELDPEFSQDVENNEVIDADDAEEEAVSYTHLDVYKRQRRIRIRSIS